MNAVPWATMMGVFSASLLGGLHCVGMCGPFVAVYSTACSASGQNRPAQLTAWLAHAAYHGGRALTYIALGALGGAAGAAINWAGEAAGLVRLAALLCSGLVIVWGLGVLFPQMRISTPLDRLLQRRLVQLGNKPRVFRASLLGVFTPVLPCGWLYAFVVTAAGTGSALSGSLVMAAFWLGTVPALLGAGALLGTLGTSLRRRLPVLTGAALILVGLFGVVSRVLMPVPTLPDQQSQGVAGKPCH